MITPQKLLHEAKDLLPLKYEIACYDRAKYRLEKVLTEPDTFYRDEKILAESKYLSKITALSTIVDGLTLFYLYRAIDNTYQEHYELAIPAFIASIGIRLYYKYRLGKE